MIDLNDAKIHLRVDGNEEDSIIQLYIDAALEKTSVILGRKLIAPSATPSDESEIALILQSRPHVYCMLVCYTHIVRRQVPAALLNCRLGITTY